MLDRHEFRTATRGVPWIFVIHIRWFTWWGTGKSYVWYVNGCWCRWIRNNHDGWSRISQIVVVGFGNQASSRKQMTCKKFIQPKVQKMMNRAERDASQVVTRKRGIHIMNVSCQCTAVPWRRVSLLRLALKPVNPTSFGTQTNKLGYGYGYGYGYGISKDSTSCSLLWWVPTNNHPSIEPCIAFWSIQLDRSCWDYMIGFGLLIICTSSFFLFNVQWLPQ